MNEKIKEIREFDGWDKYIEFVTPNYLIDLNALHRVALDLMDMLKANSDNPLWMGRSERQKCWMLRREINFALFKRPINGQYTDLVDAVYDAIVYLKKHSQCQPK